MSDPCEFKKEIMEMGKTIAGMEKMLANAIEQTRSHIEAGSKWRIAIFCSCVGLVGLFITGAITFGVNNYRLGKVEVTVEKVQNQILDLNFVKGQQMGYSQAKVEDYDGI